MSKVEISAEFDPETGFFWAMFATVPGQQEKSCPMVTLYENSEGKFFAAKESRNVRPASVELIEDLGEWLDDRVKWLKLNAISGRLT